MVQEHVLHELLVFEELFLRHLQPVEKRLEGGVRGSEDGQLSLPPERVVQAGERQGFAEDRELGGRLVGGRVLGQVGDGR